MIEAIVAHDALRTARAIHHAVDPLQIGLAVFDPATGRRAVDVGGALRSLNGARVRCRVRREQAVIDPRLAPFRARAIELEALTAAEHLEHFAHRLRTISGLGRILQADPIRLEFVLAAIALDPRAGTDVGEICHGARARDHGGGRREDRGGDAAALTLRRMLHRHVRDLVPEHGGEFCFRVQIGQQATMHVDVAAAGGERVDGVIVHHHELELGIRHVALARDALADFADVILHGLVFVDAIGLDDLLVRLATGFRLALHRAGHGGAGLAGAGCAGAGLGGRFGAREQRGAHDQCEQRREQRGEQAVTRHQRIPRGPRTGADRPCLD